MKACVLESIGNLVYKDVPMPRTGADQVLLHVRACGICSSDIDRVYHTGTYHFPTILGHEFAGDIVDVGEGVEKALIGKSAVVFPLRPCFTCPSCKKEEYARCNSYSYYGSRCDGGMAEYLVVDKWNLLVFEHIPYHIAALCEPAAVALHAVRRADMQKKKTALVVGTGTIGYLIGMWAKAYGASRTVMLGRNPYKLQKALEMGFDAVVDLTKGNPQGQLDALMEGSGVEYSFECVGSADAVKQTLDATARGGTSVLVGNPKGIMELERNVYWEILRKELTIHGTWNSSYGNKANDWKDAIEELQRGNISMEPLITHRLPMKECNRAFEILKHKKEQAIKIVLTND